MLFRELGTFAGFAAIVLAGLLCGQALAAQDDQDRYARIRLEGGPHLHGDAYRALREKREFEVLTFETSWQEKSGQRALSIVLGPDFVIEREGPETTVYDFRYRRLLRVNGGGFSNDSLFGQWRKRWAYLQNNLYAFGLLAAAGGGNEKPELMRFWAEQNNGLNHPQESVGGALPRPDIRVRDQNGRTVVSVEDKAVATADPGQTGFPGARHAATFSAWLAWSLRFHPQVAAHIPASGKVPVRIERLVRSLGAEEPETVIVSIRNVSLSSDRFDVLAGQKARNSGWPPHFPQSLAALMASAARGEAANGPVSDDTYARQIRGLLNGKKALDALLLAIHASHPYDGCSDESLSIDLCRAVRAAAENSVKEPRSRALIEAINHDSAGQHADAVRMFVPLRTKDLERPDILDIMILNSLVEGKKKNQLDGPLGKMLEKLPPRIEAAFRRDPYNPSRYRDYYNYLLAIVTDVNEGYDVQARAYAVMDLARALPQRRMPSIVSSFTEMEAAIGEDFPVHFPASAAE